MFNISGPPIVTSPQRSEDATLALRTNQRVIAEVLQVSGENVVLAIDGVRFVAKLTSAEQNLALQERRFAQFIVKDATPNQILMQLAPGPNPAAIAAAGSSPDLARVLLTQLGVPTTEANLLILRSMLARNLPADLNTFGEIQSALNALGPWGTAEAQAAAALKSAGLPVTAATLNLVLNAPQETAQAYNRLLNLLQGLSGRQISPQAAEALQKALASLRNASPEWTGNSSAMAESLRQAVALLGHSVEAGLAENLNGAKPQPISLKQAGGLLQLLALRRELAQSGPRDVVDAIDRFLDALRLQQFKSSEPEPAPGRSEWIHLQLPLHVPPPTDQPAPHAPPYQDAHLRLACRREGDVRAVEPGFTRLSIAMDLENGASIEVDLSVVEKKVGLQVTASAPALCDLAEGELAAFTQGLNELGYDLQTSRFDLGSPRDPLKRGPAEIRPEKYLAIDLEV